MRDNDKLIKKLITICGSDFIITSKLNKKTYSKWWRYGEGEELAVTKQLHYYKFGNNLIKIKPLF